MTGIIDWAASRARMVVAFVVLSLVVGTAAYVGLPKEGEPDIDIPGLFVSVPFRGISAEDSERLLVRPMESEFQDLDGLTTITATAAEGFAGLFLEFEFGWDKGATIADVRDAMGRAEAQFPEGAESYSINEINFSEFPIIVVALSGDAPERTLIRLAQDMQDALETLTPVLEAGLAGSRDEMLEVIIDPIALEAYDVTAGDLINAVVNNNQLIAAGEVETEGGAISVKIPSSFDSAEDVYNLVISVDGDRVVTLGDLAEIRLTYQDRSGTARFNGEPTIALQVVKRLGFNIMDTADLVRQTVEEVRATWPQELRDSVRVDTTLDQSVQVDGMVRQLEGSVLTAIALVMIVVLASLGTRSALLVGFAIPTSFLLCFILLGIMGIPVSNIVMFGLILAVGMLVDGAIVVVEYADKRLQAGARPMQAYTDAAKRMFWPVVSSTATTLCAFLPMLFWPGVPGEFMGMLPVTLIFVLSASLIVALIYLPVLGGVAARFSRVVESGSAALKRLVPVYLLRVGLAIVLAYGLFQAALLTINGQAWFPPGTAAVMTMAPGMIAFVLLSATMSVVLGSIQRPARQRKVQAGYRRSPFGWLIHAIVGNPVMPLVMIAAVGAFVITVFSYFGENNNGVEFFVETEPENAIVYVRARGNLSVDEQDHLVGLVEREVLGTPGIRDVFAFAGDGGLNNNTGGASAPADTIGQVQVDLEPWGERADGDLILDRLQTRLDRIPGIEVEIFSQANGPASGKPVDLRLSGDNWDELQAATRIVRAHFETRPGLTLIEDTLPLPGIDWQIDVDVEAAGRFGADVATVGAMVQLVTRGILLDTMRVPSSDEEIDIRVRFPDEARVLSTLDTMRVRTMDGLVPLSNFVSYTPAPQLAEINRVDQSRVFEVKADVLAAMVRATDAEGQTVAYLRDSADPTVAGGADFTFNDTGWQIHLLMETGVTADTVAAGLEDGTLSLVPVTANERIERITEWLEAESPLPASVEWEWAGDQEDQAESQAFLGQAFGAALGLMFIILLAQFNSVYNSVLVLLAVVLSTTGVLIGMLVMDQTFSIIMTGTGIVALAGIVVNNNIVLIDTYQEYARYMPRLEAITRTAEARIRPVLLTTITTMAGLAPMMFGVSLDFAGGGYTIDSPTALWWKQLATAVVFGLGIATVLTLVFTPSLLALRVWSGTIMGWIGRALARLGARRMSQRAQDWALARAARRTHDPMIYWDEQPDLPRLDDPAPEVPTDPADPGFTPPEPPAHDPAPRPDSDDADDPNTPPHPPLRAAE
ncbi:RND multidrug efflux transporter, Acriflavin resistance protein [Roseibacterium elongatum DSM 19469]|uniref:RND multidrug efflux transporter, Acriflavin resistance protein n=1 Tax=Roseicyclus elongatus DSM 19469 TaxID=1294273 RepID=W8RVC5_9RHOB|nr:efflux RND transporter permease subunit [Roseibacterium elongatum]AHM05164.1 RND multidrug efflux transporter, Acriflavin resistance protein [Roseibacterium elongatum DSM 19469]